MKEIVNVFLKTCLDHFFHCLGEERKPSSISGGIRATPFSKISPEKERRKLMTGYFFPTYEFYSTVQGSGY